ncbi:MAG: hypothetical protein WB463_02375, partial [Pseudolabrys sp.]
FRHRSSSKGYAALIFLKGGVNANDAFIGRRFARTVRLYLRIVERLVITIKGCLAEGRPDSNMRSLPLQSWIKHLMTARMRKRH